MPSREQERAQREADEAAARASRAALRPRVLIDGEDFTERVVSVVDALMGSLDAGSGFLDDDTTKAMESLATTLKFDGYKP